MKFLPAVFPCQGVPRAVEARRAAGKPALLSALVIFGLAQADVASLPRSRDGFDYAAEWVQHYCNVDMDWGPIPQNEEFEVKQVVAFIRHGARLPERGGNVAQANPAPACWADDRIEFQCNPQRELVGGVEFRRHSGAKTAPSVWQGSCALGQLVPHGETMEQNNGRRVFEAYPGLLGEAGSDPDRDWVLRSDNKERTIRSGQFFAAGLLEARAKAAEHSAPAPVLRWFVDDDSSSPMTADPLCPRWHAVADDYFANGTLALQREFQPYLEKLQAFLGKSVAGKPLESLGNIGKLVDCLQAHICPTVTHGAGFSAIPAPFLQPADGGAATLLARVLEFSRIEYDLYFWKRDAARLSAGNLISDVLSNLAGMDSAAHREEVAGDPKFLLYSGHDNGPIAPLLGLLQARGLSALERRPAYASMILLEVGAERARWIYNGKVLDSEMCPGGSCEKRELFQRLLALVPTPAECGLRGYGHAQDDLTGAAAGVSGGASGSARNAGREDASVWLV